MAVTLEGQFTEIDMGWLRPLIAHDPGEAAGGDIPAPEQSGTGPPTNG